MRVQFVEYEGGLTVRKTHRTVTEAKPLINCSIAEAAHEVMRMRQPTPGIAFARKDSWCPEPKLRARYRVMQAFDGLPDRALIFTLPGAFWNFETLFYQRRGGRYGKGCTKDGRTQTFFYCVENDPAIFRAALVKMPFQHRSKGITSLPHLPPFATAGFRTARVVRFYQCSFEEAAAPRWPLFDGAWLDFTGPLTPKLLAAIKAFWPRVRSTLVVTTLKARWPEGFSEIVADRGVPSLLLEACPGSEVADSYEYFDGVPMLQLVLRAGNGFRTGARIAPPSI